MHLAQVRQDQAPGDERLRGEEARLAAGGVSWVGNGRDFDVGVRAGVEGNVADVGGFGAKEVEVGFGEGWRVGWGGEVGEGFGPILGEGMFLAGHLALARSFGLRMGAANKAVGVIARFVVH